MDNKEREQFLSVLDMLNQIIENYQDFVMPVNNTVNNEKMTALLTKGIKQLCSFCSNIVELHDRKSLVSEKAIVQAMSDIYLQALLAGHGVATEEHTNQIKELMNKLEHY